MKRWTYLAAALFALAVPLLAQVNLKGAGAQAVKAAYEADRKKIEDARTKALRELIGKRLADARATLAEKKRAGNVSGMAIGNKAVEVFEAAVKQLDEKGDFELPTQGRREIVALAEECATARKPIDERHAIALKDLEARYAEQLGDKLKAEGSGEITVDQIGEFFKQLLGGGAGAAEGAGTGPGVAPGPAAPGTPDAGTNAAPDQPIVVTTSGQASNWVALARWYAGVAGIEVIDVRLSDRREEQHEQLAGAEGQPYETRYVPIRVLPAGAGAFTFQVRNLPGHDAPEVEVWPSARNGWQLTLRARPLRENPSKHGVEILVAGPGVEGFAVVGGDAEEGGPVAAAGAGDENAPTVTIKVSSIPDGAAVMIDGTAYRKGTDYLRTPCTVPMKVGRRNVRLKKFGYHDGVIAEFDAAEGRTIAWSFARDDATADRTMKLSPRSAWQSSGVTLKKGDRFLIRATEKWSCGSGKEMVDADGYPNDKKFYTYYINITAGPRQFNGANYGALLMRVGKDGAIKAVGKELRGTAEADGMLYLDVNESDDGQARRDNGGGLSVRIQKTPQR